MKGDIICHAVEIEGYWRTTPGGKRVWVESYKRQGNAAQDDLRRRVSQVREAHENMYVKPAQEQHASVQRITKQTGIPGMESYTFKKLNEARINQEKAVRAEIEHNPTFAEVAKYAATDVYEEVQTAVGNLLNEAKYQTVAVAEVIEGKTQELVDSVRSGWNAVKNFFGGLFGRKR